MSTIKRFLWASAGSWTGIFLGFAERLFITPLILSVWNTSKFAEYLALNAIVSFLNIPGKSFENIVGRECLRLGEQNKPKLITLFGGSIIISLFLEAIVLICGLLFFYYFNQDTSTDQVHSSANKWIILLSVFISRSVITFPGAIYSQVLSCFGYYHKLVWLGLIGRCLSIALSILAVLKGYHPTVVISISLLAPLLFAPFSWLVSYKWGISCNVWKWNPSLAQALKILVFSFQNCLNEGVAMLRLDGIRLMLLPLSGATNMATFSTMRTVSNTALQGLNTVTNPLMPELMRFLNQRDQARSEAAFGTIWIIVVVIMAPAIVLLQAFIKPLFTYWTHGKIPFDPILFSLLSLTILVFAIAQPAIAVVTGNNLLKSQLTISLTAAVIVIGSMYFLVPRVGILGAGIALILGEITTSIIYRSIADKWLKKQGLIWPNRSFLIASVSVWIAAISMAFIIYFPIHKLLVLLLAMLLFIWNIWRYWKALPSLATQRAKTMAINLLGMRRFFPV